MTQGRTGGRIARGRRALLRATRSRTGGAAVVVGLGSRAIVYGALSVLVFALALGDKRHETDQGNALASLGAAPGGSVLLLALVLGVACYAVWRWSVAWLGSADATDTRGRVLAVIEGAAYLPFAYLAIVVLAGQPGKADQGRRYRALSAQVLQATWGRVLVGLVGLVVTGVGGFFVYQGARRTFAEQFDFPRDRPWVRPIVLTLGVVGSIGRGVIFMIAGGLVVYAAIAVRPGAAGGLDAALDTLARQRYGALLLLTAGGCFAAFALFALAEAVWRER